MSAGIRIKRLSNRGENGSHNRSVPSCQVRSIMRTLRIRWWRVIMRIKEVCTNRLNPVVREQSCH